MELTYRMNANPRRTLVLACGVFLTAGITLAGLGPALPQLALNVGYDIAALGWMFTAISAGIVLSQFGAGLAGHRLGQRPLLTAGMLVMSAGALGVSFGASMAALLGGALLIGLGFGSVIAAGNLLVAGLFPARSAAALNGLNVFFGIGSMIGPAVSGMAGARLGLSQAALWVGAILLLALSPSVFRRAADSHVHQAAGASHTAAPSRAIFWLLGVLLLVYVGTEVGFGAWVTVYMAASADLPTATAALAASGFWLAMTLGRVLGTMFGLRVTAPALLLASLVGVLAGALLLVLGIGSLWLSLAGVLLLGLSCGPVFPTIVALVANAADGSRRTTGLVLALGNSGGLIIPALIGLLLSRSGSAVGSRLVLGAALVMIALCAIVVRFELVRLQPRG